MEKRLPIAIVVNLGLYHVQDGSGSELTYTDNVSAHGACVVSNHPWQPGEIADVTSLSDHIAMRGKVVHSTKRGEEQYAIGLSFRNCEVIWSAYLKYAGRPQPAIPNLQQFVRGV